MFLINGSWVEIQLFPQLLLERFLSNLLILPEEGYGKVFFSKISSSQHILAKSFYSTLLPDGYNIVITRP